MRPGLTILQTQHLHVVITVITTLPHYTQFILTHNSLKNIYTIQKNSWESWGQG